MRRRMSRPLPTWQILERSAHNNNEDVIGLLTWKEFPNRRGILPLPTIKLLPTKTTRLTVITDNNKSAKTQTSLTTIKIHHRFPGDLRQAAILTRDDGDLALRKMIVWAVDQGEV